MTAIPLRKCIVLGRDRDSDFTLDGIEVSRRHLSIERVGDRFVAKDLGSRAGTLLNGRHITERQLVYGDVLTLGRHHLRFNGNALILFDGARGADMTVSNLTKIVVDKTILQDISVRIEPGQFVGILGTSGAGKSTLLDILCGVRTASSGQVCISGLSIDKYLRSGPSACGYVPQADIVHLELTVREAVLYAALLRLPKTASRQVLEDSIDATLLRLGIKKLSGLSIHKLSGGQRKRVSIAVEVVSRPSLLFLDEPSSGLDPATEFKLMEQLRELANVGCTVVCTTHVMDNVHVFDKLIILRSGRLIFVGSPHDAREHFKIDRFVQLYERIESRSVEHWVSAFSMPSAEPSSGKGSVRTVSPSSECRGKVFILLHRQCCLFLSDIKNPVVLLGQPILIGALVAWMGEANGFKLFFAHLATFWFGCSNASQEIVKENAVYRRERLIGVSRSQYLSAKGAFWLTLTLLQAYIMYATLHFGPKALGGDFGWQMVALTSTAACGVVIGFAISAWVKTAAQASMLVPLILLPQVILSGYVIAPIKEKGMKKAMNEIMPSHASQFLMDTSLLWNTKFDLRDQAAQKDQFPAQQNIADQVGLVQGEIYDDDSVARANVRQLTIWSIIAVIVTWIGLEKTESEQ